MLNIAAKPTTDCFHCATGYVKIKDKGFVVGEGPWSMSKESIQGAGSCGAGILYPGAAIGGLCPVTALSSGQSLTCSMTGTLCCCRGEQIIDIHWNGLGLENLLQYPSFSKMPLLVLEAIKPSATLMSRRGLLAGY